jgi:hypothetical protein
MTEFKIENFCEDHNEEFKKYYEYLNNPIYISIFTYYLQFMNNEQMKNKIKEMIKKNKVYVYERLNIIDQVIYYYEQNNLIKKSEIGHFFMYYKKNRSKINLKNNKLSNNILFELFYKMISYDKLISVLKEIFYIFSEYRACIYFLTPSIHFYNTDKKTKDKIEQVVLAFRDNLNTLNQIVSKIYIGDKNPWGSPLYSSAYAMFDTLIILKKYYEDPLKKLKINFLIEKKCLKKNILPNIIEKINKLNNNYNINNLKNISEAILYLRKRGYDLWFTIPFLFDIIYPKYILQNISYSNVIGSSRIYQQKMNHTLGVLCFILCEKNFISNINIFQKFND